MGCQLCDIKLCKIVLCDEVEEEEEELMFMTSREISPVLTFPNFGKLKLTFFPQVETFLT